MTERLADLMRAEADALDIPAPPASDVYGQGRRLRRRKQFTAGVAAAAMVAVVGAGTTVAVQSFDGSDGDRASEIDTAAQAAYVQGASLTVDNTVYLGDRTTAEVKDDVHSLHYTSAGLLVRTNKNGGASDGSGPESYTLVRPDGSTREFGVLTEEQTPGSDPTLPYLAWAEADEGGAFSVVLLDVRSGEEKRVPVPGTHEWGGWSAPPVSLSGDFVYAGTNEAILMINWRTGDVAPSEHLEGGFPDVEGGRFSTTEAGKSVVADAETGDALLELPGAGPVDLSPDGRFAKYGDPFAGNSFEVYEVSTGAHRSFAGGSFDYGWAADGHLFTLDNGKVKTCDPGTGECATAYEVPSTQNAHIRLAGVTHES
jgi:hypothetical protein